MKDSKGHGSNSRGRMPLHGHAYHGKSDAELRFIAKDAAEAARAMQGHSPASENKYLDQVNDASTVLGYRQRGGSQVNQDAAAAHTLASPGHPKVAPAPVHSGASGRHDYNPEAVNQAIASNNRHGPKIGGKEAKLIHRLMKGRG